MSKVQLVVGDRTYTNLSQIRGLEDNLILKLVKEFGHSLYQIPFRIELVIEGLVVVRYKKFSTTLPHYVLKYFPEVGDIDYYGRVVKATNLSERRVYFTNQEDIPLSRVHIVKKASELKKEVKETPFEDITIVLESDFLCNVTKIGWTPKEGNILQVSSLSTGGVFFEGHISEKEFMKQNIIILSNEGKEFCKALENTSSLDKVVNTKLGVYDCYITPSLSIVFKQFKNHGKDIVESCSSLRNFCERFSEDMIRR